MEVPIPIAPPVPFPSNLSFPDPIFAEPKGPEFEWAPVPIYVEDIPNPIPPPNPRPAVAEDSEADVDAEDEEDQASSENQDEAKSTEGSGKPEAPPIDLVPEIAEIQTVELPVIGIEIPLPRTEILVTATTTAGVSSVVAVGGTLFATTLFRQLQPILKPIFKTVLKKLAKVRKKPPPLSYGREKLLARRQRKLGKKDLKGG